MVQLAMLDVSAGLCIDGTGDVTVGQYQSCGWTPPNGATAVLVVTNSGANALTIVVSGAPATVFATNGSALNGQHILPANQPTANVTAFADFRGQQVMIFNMSNPATDARVVTSVPGMKC